MLLRVLRDLLSPRAKPLIAYDKAAQFVEQGDIRSAIAELQQHLTRVPHDIIAINNLGCLLSDTGDEAGAARCFDLAYSLDDSFLPSMINHAKTLKEQKKSTESLKFLWQAKAFNPDLSLVNSVYASVANAYGDAETGKRYTLKTWLGSFDNLRFANSYLFNCAYADIDELTLAAEHKFWAETVLPFEFNPSDPSVKTLTETPPPAKSPNRIRIGYWSPDFRNHSVRYFFRPLIENHDRSRFEVFLYYDHPVSDSQTDDIRKNADHYFFNVSEFPDQKLVAFIKSHSLDVLVELAGHSSANRLPLLQERLATIQITGLGYPPTTGLSTIDAKFMDVHMNSTDEEYYTEAPLILPSSFWCFDPYEDAPITPEPPANSNGYVTFACVGNIAKNSQRIIKLWAEILERVPNSKLLLRSLNFADEAAVDECNQKMLAAGIPTDRLMLLPPEGGANFFASYNSIDIVLDTFPFNGGTTTCFATYMGVPVVSLAGKSLISRMGNSILNNLGMSDWVVNSETEYVERAVAASSDMDSLRRFRAEARDRYKKSALGNGRLFATDVENAYLALLEKKKHKESMDRTSRVPDLPPQELVKRAYTVMSSGQEDAAQRIVDYCLRAHPSFSVAHILWTQQIKGEDRFSRSAKYLMQRLGSFEANTRAAALINIARNFMLAADHQSARQALNMAQQYDVSDILDAAQIRLLDLTLKATESDTLRDDDRDHINRPISICMVIVGEKKDYAKIVGGIGTTCLVPNNIKLSYINSPEGKKGEHLSSTIGDLSSDIVIWVNKNASICSRTFLSDIIVALEHCDLVGFSGALIYDRIDWRRCDSSNKAGSYLSPSAERSDCFEVQVAGVKPNLMVEGMAILDGTLFAFCPGRIREHGEFEFDPFLESGGFLMEEYFTYLCSKAGLRLAVHQGLGVMVDWRVPILSEYLGDVRWHLTQKLNFDPFANLPEDRMVISTPVDSLDIGARVQKMYFGNPKQ